MLGLCGFWHVNTYSNFTQFIRNIKYCNKYSKTFLRNNKVTVKHAKIPEIGRGSLPFCQISLIAKISFLSLYLKELTTLGNYLAR